jgi:hypothetical protein
MEQRGVSIWDDNTSTSLLDISRRMDILAMIKGGSKLQIIRLFLVPKFLCGSYWRKLEYERNNSSLEYERNNSSMCSAQAHRFNTILIC